MKLASLQHDHDECLRKGADLLGTSVRAVSLDWPVEQLLRAHLHLEARLGLDLEHPFLSFTSGPKGQDLEFGLERYRLEIEGKSAQRIGFNSPGPRNRNGVDSRVAANRV